MQTDLATTSRDAAPITALAPREPSQNPAAFYLASLTSKDSKRTMKTALDTIGAIVSEGACLSCFAFDWAGLRRQHTEIIRAQLADRYKPATANKMLCALRGVLEHAWNLDQISTDDFHRAKAVKSIKGEALPAGRALEKSELTAMLRACPDTATGLRDKALLAIAFGAGLRRSEVVSLDLADFNAATGTITVRQGKGRRERLVQTPAFVTPLVGAWLAVRSDIAGALLLPTDKSGRIKHGQRLSDQTVLTALERCCRRVGGKSFSPHDLRRSYATHLFEAGADAPMIQQLMGHQNIATTQKYDRRGEEAKQKAADMLTLAL